jgi:hypothetical protein
VIDAIGDGLKQKGHREMRSRAHLSSRRAINPLITCY